MATMTTTATIPSSHIQIHTYVSHIHFELKVISLHPFLLLFALSVYISIFHSTTVTPIAACEYYYCCCSCCFCYFFSVFAIAADGFFTFCVYFIYSSAHTHKHTRRAYTLNFLLIKTLNCE